MNSQLLLPSPSGRCLVKLAMLLVFCCFAESASGSCIRYGHSCWGAHGKRSHHDNTLKNNAVGLKNDPMLNEDARWFIARLLQTNENRLLKGLRDQMDDNQTDDGKPSEDVSLSDSEQVKLGDVSAANEPPLNSIINDKFRFIKYL
ncbi:neuropeptide CCHamide-1 isoform X2 [Atheta coriaria]